MALAPKARDSGRKHQQSREETGQHGQMRSQPHCAGFGRKTVDRLEEDGREEWQNLGLGTMMYGPMVRNKIT